MRSAYTQSERWADGVVHGLGLGFSAVAVTSLLFLAARSGDARIIVAATAYSAGLLAMFGLSAAYNLVTYPSWRTRLRRYDHAAIFLMIAGTYTPFALVSIRGPTGYGLLALVWGGAITGALLKLLCPERLERASLMLYLALGWIGLAASGALLAALPGSALVLLLLGGVLYTVGVVFHLWVTLLYQNAIWHGFVLVAAVCHFVAVLQTLD